MVRLNPWGGGGEKRRWASTVKVMSCLNCFQMLMIGSMGKFSDDKEKNTAFLISNMGQT